MTALESGRLKVAKGLRHGEALVRELRDFRVTVTSPGRTAHGGTSEHDDLGTVSASPISSTPTSQSTPREWRARAARNGNPSA